MISANNNMINNINVGMEHNTNNQNIQAEIIISTYTLNLIKMQLQSMQT